MLEKELDKATLAENSLNDLVAVARNAFAEDLVAAVVFGSAADGTLRETSDVNLMLILTSFKQQQADQVREALRLAKAVVDMHVMFIIESELPTAVKAFALKFSDIKLRHRILYGKDLFSTLVTTREDLIANARQILLNFQLRTREQYILLSLREEQLVSLIADAAAPLRTSAVALRHIRNEAYVNAKVALEIFVSKLEDEDFSSALKNMSHARETASLSPGVAASVLMTLLELSHRLFNEFQERN
jgi:predicted nucleotidyltransferase